MSSWTGEHSRYVFHEHEGGTGLIDDSPEFGPQPPLVFRACPLPCNAVRLTGDSARDNIHDSTPRAAIEGGKVIPDSSRSQGAVLHTRDQDCGCSGFPLNETDSPIGISEGNGEPVFEPADSGAQGNSVDGTYSHIGLKSGSYDYKVSRLGLVDNFN